MAGTDPWEFSIWSAVFTQIYLGKIDVHKGF